jgi:hypothetical protein
MSYGTHFRKSKIKNSDETIKEKKEEENLQKKDKQANHRTNSIY